LPGNGAGRAPSRRPERTALVRCTQCGERCSRLADLCASCYDEAVALQAELDGMGSGLEARA
jgi:hypothetical protein